MWYDELCLRKLMHLLMVVFWVVTFCKLVGGFSPEDGGCIFV
jgi:hypothetical protein